MKRIFVLSIVVLVLSGWFWQKEEKPVITIDGIQVTAKEFQNAFKSSRFAAEGEKGKEDFLDTYISRKIMLKQAEDAGLDKDPEFLNSLQQFWEQSLLKLVLSAEVNKLSAKIKVGDDEIQKYYNENKDKDFKDSELSDVYSQIKWVLFKKKQSETLHQWIDNLKKQAKIKIDYDALGVRPTLR